MSDVNRTDVKQCCAAFYGSDFARLLIGESFHPGGIRLTHHLGTLTQLEPGSKVLDLAAGRGTSALHTAQSFGCEVVGIDLSEGNVRAATEEASLRGLANRVSFQVADAEGLPFKDESFGVILCECAFCTFPNKQSAAAEMFRVLSPGGRLAFSDLTKIASAHSELDGLLSWIACVGDAQPVQAYTQTFERANLTIVDVEDHRAALIELIRQIQGRLLGAEIATGLGKLDLPGVDFSNAKHFIQAALSAVQDGTLGYTAITAIKPR